MMHRESFSYDNCVVNARNGSNLLKLLGLRCDSGLEDMVADSNATNPELKATIINEKLSLNFGGKIARWGQKGWLKVAEAFGMSFYLHGRGFDPLSGSVTCVPAWMVKADSCPTPVQFQAHSLHVRGPRYRACLQPPAQGRGHRQDRGCSDTPSFSGGGRPKGRKCAP